MPIVLAGIWLQNDSMKKCVNVLSRPVRQRTCRRSISICSRRRAVIPGMAGRHGDLRGPLRRHADGTPVSAGSLRSVRTASAQELAAGLLQPSNWRSVPALLHVNVLDRRSFDMHLMGAETLWNHPANFLITLPGGCAKTIQRQSIPSRRQAGLI